MTTLSRFVIAGALVGASVWTAYGGVCDTFFADCTDVPCPGGCGSATGSPTTIKTCVEPVGGTCCWCVRVVHSCTICGSTSDASTTTVAPGDCVSNGRICEAL